MTQAEKPKYERRKVTPAQIDRVTRAVIRRERAHVCLPAGVERRRAAAR